MSPKIIDESLPATAPPDHLGFRKGSLSLYVITVIGTFVCDKNHSLTVTTPVGRWLDGKAVHY